MDTILANRENYGKKRSTADIKYIVIHYTGNNGDTARNNGVYFQNNVVKASAHYFVDSKETIQSVPDDYIAYSVGGAKYNTGGRLYKIATNANTLNIELCDDDKSGGIYPSAKTIENALFLAKWFMGMYNIPKENVIRHYDVNGKPCPAYWVDNERWHTEFWDKLDKDTTPVKPEEVDIPTDQNYVYRLYSGEHFFTTNPVESRVLINAGWHYEGVAWIAPIEGVPVHRLYNQGTGQHHYTSNEGEASYLATLADWIYEGVVFKSGGSTAIHRLYNPNDGTHMLTASGGEVENLTHSGWIDEGIGMYGV